MLYEDIQEIVEREFQDIVEFTRILDGKLRIFFKDKSFLDIWISKSVKGRFAFHWERRHIDGSVYRHDNIPHKAWMHVKTFPKHFHSDREKNVVDSNLSPNPKDAVKEFLEFIRKHLHGR